MNMNLRTPRRLIVIDLDTGIVNLPAHEPADQIYIHAMDSLRRHLKVGSAQTPGRGRLFNWKFETALRYIDQFPDGAHELLRALSRLFGDVGWFSGDMATVIEYALNSIGIDPDGLDNAQEKSP